MFDAAALRITSPRLVMRPFTANDAADAFPCITPTLTRFMSWDPPATPADFASVWQSWLSAPAGSGLQVVIRDVQGEFVGLAGVHQLSSDTPELGIWLRESAHGQGLGSEAVRALWQWASAEQSRSHFVYPVAEENLVSRRIAEALGGTVVHSTPTRKYQRVTYHIPPA